MIEWDYIFIDVERLDDWCIRWMMYKIDEMSEMYKVDEMSEMCKVDEM